MSYSVEFAHGIGDTVKVTALDLPARVIAVMVDAEGPAYRVVYWSDACRKSEWVFAWELA